MQKIPIKNHHQEVQLITRRMMFAFIVMFVLLLLLMGRLYFLQVHKHSVYNTLSTKNRLDLIPIEPTRGLIFDRNGILLAENIPVFSLDVLPYKVANISRTLSALSRTVSLSENEINQFKRQLKHHRRFEEIPLKVRLTETEVARFAENQHRFPGVMIKARLIRHYPFGESFSHVLGYVGRINAHELNEIDQANYSASYYIGKLGIEKYYENELHGRVGYQEVESDASGKPIRVLKEIISTPGKNLYLSLDSGLQFIAERALSGRGAIVAIQPQTGEVLAMVSQPGFDPNLFVIGISQKDYQSLQQSSDRPLFDRALRGLYPFASTIKPFIALQALDNGVITPDFSIIDDGIYFLRNYSRPFHDWTKQGHGRVNISKAISASCDVFFYDLALRMGIRQIDDILDQFGFGTTTGIDLHGELAGIVASPEWKQKVKGIPWYEGDTVQSGIGQGYMQATPLQLATATAALANRGQRVLPHLLVSNQMPGSNVMPIPPTPLTSVVLKDARYWPLVIKAMEDVIRDRQGTAYHFGRNLSYSIAAKTGTGQVSKRRVADERDKQEKLPEKLRDHHLFIAFAPTDRPQIALAIVTENSNTSVEAARVIMDYYLIKNRDKTPQSHSLSAKHTHNLLSLSKNRRKL